MSSFINPTELLIESLRLSNVDGVRLAIENGADTHRRYTIIGGYVICERGFEVKDEFIFKIFTSETMEYIEIINYLKSMMYNVTCDVLF